MRLRIKENYNKKQKEKELWQQQQPRQGHFAVSVNSQRGSSSSWRTEHRKKIVNSKLLFLPHCNKLRSSCPYHCPSVCPCILSLVDFSKAARPQRKWNEEMKLETGNEVKWNEMKNPHIIANAWDIFQMAKLWKWNENVFSQSESFSPFASPLFFYFVDLGWSTSTSFSFLSIPFRFESSGPFWRLNFHIFLLLLNGNPSNLAHFD